MSYLKEDWKGTPVEQYFDWKLTFTGVKNGDIWVGSEQIKKEARILHKDWTRSWKSLHIEPSGQVKNYLVALRTIAQAPRKESLRIFLRGSKMQEVGGLWHGMFLDYVAQRNPYSEVTFCDPAEVPRHDHEKLKVHYVVGKVQRVEADVLVDDAQEYLHAEKPPEGNYRYYSLKKQGTEYVTKENRFFSHEREGESLCPCRTCKAISQIVESYEEDQLLRNHLQALGHPRCYVEGTRGTYVASDMKKVSVQMVQYARSAKVQLRTPQDERVLPTAAHFLGLRVKDGNLVEKRGIQESRLPRGWQTRFSYYWTDHSCSHKECNCELFLHSEDRSWKIEGPDYEVEMSSIIKKHVKCQEGDCHVVRGKRAIFVGVPPTFFGSTVLSSGSEAEVAVIARGTHLFLPVPLVFAQEEQEGYRAMPYSWKGFRLYVRHEDLYQRIQVPGFIPIITRDRVRIDRYDPGIRRGYYLYLHKSGDQWELTSYKTPESTLRLVVSSGTFSVKTELDGEEPVYMCRPTFVRDWYSSQVGTDVAFRYRILRELAVYARDQQMLYSKVLQFPPEIIALIDFFIIT
jgi:hypothetical protein